MFVEFIRGCTYPFGNVCFGLHPLTDPSNLVLTIYFAEISTPRARGHCWLCNAKEAGKNSLNSKYFVLQIYSKTGLVYLHLASFLTS